MEREQEQREGDEPRQSGEQNELIEDEPNEKTRADG